MKYIYLMVLLNQTGKIAVDMKNLLNILKDKNVFKEPIEYRIEGCAIFIKTKMNFDSFYDLLNDQLASKNISYLCIQKYFNSKNFGYGPTNLWDWMTE